MTTPVDFDVSSPREKGHDIRCCMCGHWINNFQYGSMFEGKFIDFMNKNYGSINMTFCIECTTKIMELTDQICAEEDYDE